MRGAPPQGFQRSLQNVPVGDILVAVRSLREQKPLKIDGPDRNTLQIDRLGVGFEHFVCLAARAKHDVHHEGVSQTDIFAFAEPRRV